MLLLAKTCLGHCHLIARQFTNFKVLLLPNQRRSALSVQRVFFKVAGWERIHAPVTVALHQGN